MNVGPINFSPDPGTLRGADYPGIFETVQSLDFFYPGCENVLRLKDLLDALYF